MRLLWSHSSMTLDKRDLMLLKLIVRKDNRKTMSIILYRYSNACCIRQLALHPPWGNFMFHCTFQKIISYLGIFILYMLLLTFNNINSITHTTHKNNSKGIIFFRISWFFFVFVFLSELKGNNKVYKDLSPTYTQKKKKRIKKDVLKP